MEGGAGADELAARLTSRARRSSLPCLMAGEAQAAPERSLRTFLIWVKRKGRAKGLLCSFPGPTPGRVLPGQSPHGPSPGAHWAHTLAPHLTPAPISSWDKNEGLLLASLESP